MAEVLKKVKLGTQTGEFSRNLRAAYARAGVRVKATKKEPLWTIAEVTIPLISVAAYVFLYRVLNAPPTFTSFVLIGGTMIAFWANVLWNMSAQFYWEKETGNLEMYFIAPISRMAILLGMALGGMFNTSTRALSIIIIGSFLFNAPLRVADPFAAIVVFTLTILSLYALGMLFASLFMLYGREAWHMTNLLQEPVYFMSGFFFPIVGNRFFPFAIQVAASFIPLTVGLDAIRRVLVLGAGFSQISLHVLGLLAFVSVLFPLSKKGLDFMEGLAKREGRLTLRWQ